MSARDYLYRRFKLNGKMVEVRRVQDGERPEVVVRHVNDDDQLSHTEFPLRLSFLIRHGKPMAMAGGPGRVRKAVVA